LVTKYGAAAINEAMASGVCVALGLLAVIAAPLAARRSWGWTLPALLSLPLVVAGSLVGVLVSEFLSGLA